MIWKVTTGLLGGVLFPVCSLADIDKPLPIKTAAQIPSGTSGQAIYSESSLRGRGLDPALLQALDRQSRFPAGTSLVDIHVNGDFKGAFEARFGPQGDLCFTPALFKQLNLSVPSLAVQASAQGECFNWQEVQPGVSLKYQTQTLGVSIVVPQNLLQLSDGQQSGERGGTAAMLNYDFYQAINHSVSGQQTYAWLSLENGLNVNNWLLRSRQQIQRNEQGEIHGNVTSMWLQHYFSGINKVLQLGQFDVSNSLFQLSDLKGMQLTPDEGLTQHDEGVTVSGLANTDQARVEVRQYGMLIFSTLVPAGTFTLNNVPIKNSNADLEVTVKETDGQQQQFTLAAGMLINGRLIRPSGFSLAMGKLSNEGRRAENADSAPALVTLGQQWQPAQPWSLQAALLLANRYKSLAAASTLLPLPGLVLNAQATAVQDDYNHLYSAQARLSASYQIAPTLSFSSSVTQSSSGFASLQQAAERDRHNFNQDKTQYSLALNWSPGSLGTFSYSHSESSRYDRPGQYRYDSFSWNRRFGKAHLNVMLSRGGGYSGSNRQLTVNFSLPLGAQRLDNYYRKYSGSERIGSQLSGPFSSDSSYRLAVDRDMYSHQQSLQAGLSSNLHYTNLNLAAGSNGNRSQNYSFGLSGGMALHRSGLTFSPGHIGDTFGLIKLNRKMAGVAINSPGGKTWTDFSGWAIAPTIMPWRKNSFDIDSASLAKNIDVANGHHDATLARGTVKRIDYAVIANNRLLLNITQTGGVALPRGSRIWDETDNLVTIAVEDGVVFLNNAPDSATYSASLPGSSQRCSFSFSFDPQQTENRAYASVNALCQ